MAIFISYVSLPEGRLFANLRDWAPPGPIAGASPATSSRESRPEVPQGGAFVGDVPVRLKMWCSFCGFQRIYMDLNGFTGHGFTWIYPLVN
jgi:hypothetical protein